MKKIRLEQLALLPYIAKWLLLACIVAVLAGSASAFFLFSLDLVTNWRETHPDIIWFLPLAGFTVGWIYLHFGKSVEAGNNLIIDEIHDPKKNHSLAHGTIDINGHRHFAFIRRIGWT